MHLQLLLGRTLASFVSLVQPSNIVTTVLRPAWYRSLSSHSRRFMASTPAGAVGNSDDALFRYIEKRQAETERQGFGRVLDAGTGWHSLRWLLSAAPGVEHVTAVTADRPLQKQCQRQVDALLGSDEATERCTILCGNWFPASSEEDTDIAQQLRKDNDPDQPPFFDVILADYLIGALDGFSPYQQDALLPKLLSLLQPGTGRLYIVGLEPIPDISAATKDDAAIISQVRQARDACILLAGHRCYREYPLDWVVRQIDHHCRSSENETWNAVVRHTKTFPILYRHATIVKQIQVGRSKLPYLPAAVRDGMQQWLEELEEASLRVTSQQANGRIRLGFDYIVTVEKENVFL